MPLPWKKARISRISRLMADLHPSNSLLLQTGFPASLVDLFVKNSDRLKKPNKKKKRTRPDRNLDGVSVRSPAADGIPAVDLCEEVERKEDLDFGVSRSVDRGFEIDCKSKEILNGGCCNGGGGAFCAVFVVLVAVILALVSVKILTLGITLSACALICLDYVRKHILCSCSGFGFPLHFPFGLFVFKTQIAVEAKPEEKEEEDEIELISPVEEIQVVESEVRFEDDNQGTEISLISEEEEDNDECDGETLEKVAIRRRSRRKEFIKKLVPKKWRKAKTAKKTDEFAGGEFSDHNEQNQELKEVTGDREIEDSQPKEEEIKISDELATAADNKEAAVRKEKRGCSCFVVVAALAGLVGGRFAAMGLTVVSCVIIRLFVMRQRQQLNSMKRKGL